MATGTAAVQAALNTAVAGDGRGSLEILRTEPTDGTYELFYVCGNSSNGKFRTHARWCVTTTAGGAAAQAAEIVAAMLI